MGFYDLAESTLLYILVAVGICLVASFTVIFLRKSWKRAVTIGYTKQQLMNVVKASISFSVVPSIGIVIGLFSLAAMLGIPWPWWRLSVIGSVSYEIMAADMALNAAGVQLASASATEFVLIMYVMTLCIMGGVVASPFIAGKIQAGTMNLKTKDQRWGALGSSVFMLTIMIVFMVPMILTGGVTLLTWLTSGIVGTIIGFIAKKFNLAWLNNFTLALSLIIAMISSVLWTNLLG